MQSIPDVSSAVQPPSFLATLQAVADKARAVLPETVHARLDRAIGIVLNGGVTLTEHGGVVQSQSQPNRKYAVNGSCACGDAVQAPQGFCKHRLAVGLFKRTTEALARQPATVFELPALEPEPLRGGLRPEWIKRIHGKAFVLYEGLLALAHERGLVSLTAHFISVTETLALAEAHASFADGKEFRECADSTPSNVNKGVAAHFPRCALTRAKARALRDALNIGMCSTDELGADDAAH
jgi:hypothetical protein